MKNVNPFKPMMTMGVSALIETRKSSYLDLMIPMIREFRKQPKVCLDGGDDREFFSFECLGTKLFAVANEVGGLTLMLPEEY